MLPLESVVNVVGVPLAQAELELELKQYAYWVRGWYPVPDSPVDEPTDPEFGVKTSVGVVTVNKMEDATVVP